MGTKLCQNYARDFAVRFVIIIRVRKVVIQITLTA